MFGESSPLYFRQSKYIRLYQWRRCYESLMSQNRDEIDPRKEPDDPLKNECIFSLIS